MTSGEKTPWHSGAQTFLKAPLVDFDRIESGMVVIGGAPHDSTHTSRFGTRMGPRGIREGSLSFAGKLQNAAGAGLVDVKTGTRLTLDFYHGIQATQIQCTHLASGKHVHGFP